MFFLFPVPLKELYFLSDRFQRIHTPLSHSRPVYTLPFRPAPRLTHNPLSCILLSFLRLYFLYSSFRLSSLFLPTLYLSVLPTPYTLVLLPLFPFPHLFFQAAQPAYPSLFSYFHMPLFFRYTLICYHTLSTLLFLRHKNEQEQPTLQLFCCRPTARMFYCIHFLIPLSPL